MIPTPILDELQALLEKAPQMPWFQIDDQPYLHFAKDGKKVAGAKPWDHPVVGRFDYGKGAMQLIELLSQHLPQLIAAARKLEEVRRDAERYRLLRAKGQCHGKVFGGFTIPGATNRNTLVAFRFWCKAAELDTAIDAQLNGEANGQ